MTTEQFDRLPGVLQDIVTIDREMKDFAALDVVPFNAGTREAFKQKRAERAEKRAYAATLWGHVARNDGSDAHA